MTTIILLRHGEKLYSNGKADTMKFDPPLTANGEKGVAQSVLELIALGHRPESIITSPFLRTRQTAVIASSILSQFGITHTVVVKPILSEYLGHHKLVEKEDFHPLTEARCLTCETKKQLKQRVNKVHYRIKNFATGTVLLVGHGYFMSLLHEKFTGSSMTLREGEYVVIQ